MTLKDYQSQALSTAIYDEKFKVIYPMLGLVDEFAEVIDKGLMAGDEKEVAKELGDFMWYFSVFVNDMNIDIDIFYILTETELVFLRGALYDKVPDCFVSLGTIAGKIKKWIRDSNCITIDNEMKEIIISNLRVLFLYVQVAALDLGYTLDEVLQMNIDKLKSRQERGVLSGSGDNR